MDGIVMVEREMTDSEFARMNAGFDEHTLASGSPLQTQERHGFVATADGVFVGCASGLAHLNGGAPGEWFTLTDLFVERERRGRGVGAALLRALEARAAGLGARRVWTWTAGFEALGFYLQQGYEVACEQERMYAGGESRIGLRKTLARERGPAEPTG